MVYFSLPFLREERVLHYIDNTPVLAALTKGYSRVVDTARIIHAFWALAVAIALEPWFIYVPSEENEADVGTKVLHRNILRRLALRAHGYQDSRYTSEPLHPRLGPKPRQVRADTSNGTDSAPTTELAERSITDSR